MPKGAIEETSEKEGSLGKGGGCGDGRLGLVVQAFLLVVRG